MTLTTNAKNYIASHFGRGDCYVSSGISYTDPNGIGQTGSTGDVVKTLRLNAGGRARGPNNETFYSIPDFQQINDDDVRGIDSDNYCIGTTSGGGTFGCIAGTTRCNRGNIETCNSAGAWIVTTHCSDGCRTVNGRPECIQSSGGGGGGSGTAETGPFEVTVGETSGSSCAAGDPSVTLDVSEAYAYYKTAPVPYIGVMKINVRNNDPHGTDCYAYFTWVMRMWDGTGFTTCPTTTPELEEVSRFLATVSDTKAMTLKKIHANETTMVSGSFEIPASAEGRKTICLTLWGNYSYQALVDELAAEGYVKEIVW